MPPPRLLCRRGSGITSPLSGEQNFYFVEFAGLFVPRLAPASRWFGTACSYLLVNPLRAGAPPILWGVLTALSYVEVSPHCRRPPCFTALTGGVASRACLCRQHKCRFPLVKYTMPQTNVKPKMNRYAGLDIRF